jgi:hypothetical protein
VITSFLNTLGEKLAERWMTTLTLPGLLFVTLAVAGHSLGQGQALDWSLLATRGSALAARWDDHPALAVLTVVAVLTAATVAGFAAQAVGAGVERCWLITGPNWLTGPFASSRLKTWQRAQEQFDAAAQAAGESDAEYRLRRGRLAAARNGIALAPPSRATWMSDRLRAVGLRVEGEYGIDLAWAWPRLWQVLPARTRTDIGAASDAFTGAATRVGWALLYLVLGAVTWWPAGIAAFVLAFSGWRAGHSAAETLASLIESAADLNIAKLAHRLGESVTGGQPTLAEGRRISERLRKGAL